MSEIVIEVPELEVEAGGEQAAFAAGVAAATAEQAAEEAGEAAAVAEGAAEVAAAAVEAAAAAAVEASAADDRVAMLEARLVELEARLVADEAAVEDVVEPAAEESMSPEPVKDEKPAEEKRTPRKARSWGSDTWFGGR